MHPLAPIGLLGLLATVSFAPAAPAPAPAAPAPAPAAPAPTPAAPASAPATPAPAPVIRPSIWAQPVLSPELKNFHALDHRIFRAAQPDEKQMQALAAAGFTDILNLRNFHDDKDEAKGTSLTLHQVSMNAGSISLEQIRQSLRIIQACKGRLLIHCWHGSDRTGCVCAFNRMVFQGWTKEQALAELRQGNYGFHECYDEIIKLIQDTDIEALRREFKPAP